MPSDPEPSSTDWHGGEFCGRCGVAQPPAAGEGLKLVGRSLPRGPSGKAARKLGARARSGSLFLVGT